MIKILVFLGIALSVVKANGWLVIPSFCTVFCWGTSIVYMLIYSFVTSLEEQIVDKMVAKYKANGCCPVCGHKKEGVDDGRT